MRAVTQRAVKGLAVVLTAFAVAFAGSTAPSFAAETAPAPLSSKTLAGVDSRMSLDAADFIAGNIISDDLFYDSNAMSQAEIQAFLNAKGGNCTNGKCLTVGRFSVDSRPISISARTGGVECGAFEGGTNLTAAEIIYRAQVACGISAKVILVTLQKEQGLITKTAPSDSALIHAMGMACPDTSPCQSYAEGFGNQIYLGTRQLNTYKAGRFATQPGIRNIQFHPNAACGYTSLNIQNYATAALYAYTPYQPNAAALANLNGTGDGCSSYGNRNFWVYYNNWFGSTLGVPPGLQANATVGEPANYVYARDFDGNLWIYPANGAGGLATRGQVGTGWSSMNLVFGAGDFDGDGVGDLFARDATGALWKYSRDGSGGWLPRVRIGSGWNTFTSVIPVGDFNGDGFRDVMALQANGLFFLYPGNGKGSWLSRVQVGSGWLFSAVFGAGDVTGDGIPDVGARDGDGVLWIYPGGGMKPANWKDRIRVGSGWGSYSILTGAGDLTGDGKTDILARDPSGQLWLHAWTGPASYAPGASLGTGWDQFSVLSSVGEVTAVSTPPVLAAGEPGVGDLDSDGRRDVLARDTAGGLWFYPGNARGGWGTPRQIGSGWQDFTALIPAGDVNGDRKQDLLARDAAGALWLYPGDGAAGWGTSIQVLSGTQGYDVMFSPGDFDGDGKSDIIARDTAGVLWLLSGNGASGFAAPRKIGAGWQIFDSVFAAGDATGDGKMDIFAREPNGALWLYPGSGNGGWGSYGKVGAGWQIFDWLVGPGDFDGDGNPDVFARQPNGDLWLYPTNGARGWRSYGVVGRGWQIFNWIG